jgi:hypothetical protein
MKTFELNFSDKCWGARNYFCLSSQLTWDTMHKGMNAFKWCLWTNTTCPFHEAPLPHALLWLAVLYCSAAICFYAFLKPRCHTRFWGPTLRFVFMRSWSPVATRVFVDRFGGPTNAAICFYAFPKPCCHMRFLGPFWAYAALCFMHMYVKIRCNVRFCFCFCFCCDPALHIKIFQDYCSQNTQLHTFLTSDDLVLTTIFHLILSIQICCDIHSYL